MTKIIATALLVFGFSAAAQARLNTWDLTCVEARSLVESSGAIVMNYSVGDRSGYLYDRFVAHGGYCALGEVTRGARVPTVDQSRCYVGYRCVQDPR